MEERVKLSRSNTSSTNTRNRRSVTNPDDTTPLQKRTLDLDLKLNLGSLEDDMLNFLKTSTDVSPKTARAEEMEELKRDLSKSRAHVLELQDQLKRLKDISKRALLDFDHFKQTVEFDKVKLKEALFTIDNLRRNQYDLEEYNNLIAGKIYLEKQLLDMREDVMYSIQSKGLIEKQLEESRHVIQSLEEQVSNYKNAAESENKNKQQINSFNSEIGKELKQLTLAKKELENSLQMHLDKLSRVQLQLSTLDTELIRVTKELEKEKSERKIEFEKNRALETTLNALKKQLETVQVAKEDKCTELAGIKLKYELLIGDLHVKVSEIEKLKSDVEYEKTIRVASEKQARIVQDLLTRVTSGQEVSANAEIPKIFETLNLFEQQKVALGIEIKALNNDKYCVMAEINDKVKEYEVVKFKQDDLLKFKNAIGSKSSISNEFTDSASRTEGLVTEIKISNDNLSSNTNISYDDKGKKLEKENWREKANNLIKKSNKTDEEPANETETGLGRNKTIRILGDGTARAKQLKNMTLNKLKKPKAFLFGGLLQERADSEGKAVPKIVTSCIKVVDQKGLRTEGIYRRAGAMKEMKNMQDEWEQGTSIDMAHDLIDVLSVSSLLKAYFRDLKVPLIPIDVYESCVSIMKEPKLNDHHLATCKSNLKKLFPAHYNTLYYLIQHLQRVSAFEEYNKMSPRNIGIVFGPTLIKLKDDPQSFFDNQPNDFVTFLIENFDKLFDIKEIIPIKEGSSEDNIYELRPPHINEGRRPSSVSEPK